MNPEDQKRQSPGISPSDFSPDIYRAYNLDLRGLSDDELREHFLSNMHQPRIYAATASTIEALSMRWLRGAGIEIDPGANPTPLFGNATALKADNDDTLFYGGDGIDIRGGIDDPKFGTDNRGRFDFAIASHVLEHPDSFLRAIEDLLLITRPGGIVYLTPPDINFMPDNAWMQNFDFAHHIAEYHEPLAFRKLHDLLFIDGNSQMHPENYAGGSPLHQEMLATKEVPAALRFLYHKHDYSFNDCLGLLVNTQDFFAGRSVWWMSDMRTTSRTAISSCR